LFPRKDVIVAAHARRLARSLSKFKRRERALTSHTTLRAHIRS
jgi:hypothetical protein